MLPVLRKDFLVDPSQVIEARAYGADAVLLIAAALADDELARDAGRGRATSGWACCSRPTATTISSAALATEAPVIGVNARDLETLEVDRGRALRQLARVPADRIAVLESGIRTRADVARAVRCRRVCHPGGRDADAGRRPRPRSCAA